MTATTTCPHTTCIAEHHLGDLDHTWPPVAVAVLDPAADRESVVLIGPGRDTSGAWIEVDVDGHGARIRTGDLLAALAELPGVPA